MKKQDMHVHSKYSRDSRLEPKDILSFAEKKGLDAVAVTDHNTIKGALACKKVESSVEVVIGAELKTDRGEVIGYHLNDEVKSTSFFEVLDEIKSQGGLVSIPHPLDRMRGSAVKDEQLMLEAKSRIDFLEVNGRTLPYFNKKTAEFAGKHDFKLIGGSDAHMLWEVGVLYTEFNGETRIGGRQSYWALYPLLRTKVYKLFGL